MTSKETNQLEETKGNLNEQVLNLMTAKETTKQKNLMNKFWI